MTELKWQVTQKRSYAPLDITVFKHAGDMITIRQEDKKITIEPGALEELIYCLQSAKRWYDSKE